MEMDCIPAGMELFPAADEEQWEFIKKIIDDCDYYLLIVGGRYGSLTNEGISYTEKEFDYAVEKGLKVVALLHENPDKISVDKSDIDPELREKLQAFRDKVSDGRLVKFWSDVKDLPGLVSLSLTKTIKTFPATGWVRASIISNEELLTELNQLRKENSALNEKVASIIPPEPIHYEGLAGLEDIFELYGNYTTDYGRKRWSVKITWGEIFAIISPYLIKNPNENIVKHVLKEGALARTNIGGSSQTLDDQVFQTVTVQLVALGLVETKYAQTTKGDMALFWNFTPKGQKLMFELRTVQATGE